MLERQNYLDKGFVELQDKMGDDLSIVNAARTSYLGESKGYDKDIKLLRYLWEHNHTSPFEMIELKFRLKIPIMVARQIMRYRTANVNEQSYRYTEANEDDIYLIDQWRLQSKSNKQMSDGLTSEANSRTLTRLFKQHSELSYQLYEEALQLGASREIARVFLPAFALYTTIIFKIDGKNLLHIFDQRLRPEAQQETKELVEIMFNMFEKHYPETSKLFLEKFNET